MAFMRHILLLANQSCYIVFNPELQEVVIYYKCLSQSYSKNYPLLCLLCVNVHSCLTLLLEYHGCFDVRKLRVRLANFDIAKKGQIQIVVTFNLKNAEFDV